MVRFVGAEPGRSDSSWSSERGHVFLVVDAKNLDYVLALAKEIDATALVLNEDLKVDHKQKIFASGSGRIAVVALEKRNIEFYLDKLLSIPEKFQGQGLSYPLMCVAIKIAKEFYGKKYVLLFDAAKKANLYEKVAFTAVVEHSLYKVGKIDDALSSEKCANSI